MDIIQKDSVQGTDLREEIREYWAQRASGYSEYNREEMADVRRILWKKKLLSLLEDRFPGTDPSEIKILDAGTGPGFFAILLAETGYRVTAVDAAEEMIREARGNAGELSDKISWKVGDVQKLEEESEAFDVVVTRNVTWNLPDPQQAYGEWYRVLRKGGVLYNFDADWYGHLFDREKRKGYENDRRRVEEQELADYYEGTDIQRMEEIARQVPLSRLERPRWDMEAMRKAGFRDVCCDENVWREVWNEEEIVNNGSTPVFLLSGKK